MNETPPVTPTAPRPKSSSLAITSLVLGILGILFTLVCIGPLFAIPAIICGHLAHSRIKRSAGALEGGGLALAGLITGYTAIAIGVVLIPMLAAIAIPNFVKARDTAQMNACINNLRQIDSAKQTWALEHRKTPTDIPASSDLDPYLKGGGFSSLICPAGGVYAIRSVSESPVCSVPTHKLPGN